MRKYKKIVLGMLVGVSLTAGCAAFVACGGDSQIVTSFVVDEQTTLTSSGEKGATVEFPSEESFAKAGYVFKGWYVDSNYSGSAVTEAVYEQGVTYYAKWAKGYAVSFDLDGGSFSTTQTTLYLEEGANVATAVKDYTPTNGDYPFGGWYVGDEPLSTGTRMTTAGITLSARYKASYTVNVYLQNLDDLTQYTKSADYATGYALIGEEYAPDITIDGYSVTTDGDTELIISKKTAENVFNLYYDRNEYTVALYANNPDSTTSTPVINSYLYGASVNLPDSTSSFDGYRFVGWATKSNATASDVIANSLLKVEGDTILYAVWEKGYTDMFGGTDTIFLNHDTENTATLYRGGVAIQGTYNVKKDIYVFSGDDVTLNVKLNSNGTFVFYSNRKGTYIQYANSSVNQNITISLDDTNGCAYRSTVEGNIFEKKGTYTIDDNGYYYATLTDAVSGEESTICFIVGTVSSSTTTYTVFRLRGDEYTYGTLSYYSKGSLTTPTISMDGFGYATVTSTSSSSTYYYTLSDDIITLRSVASSSSSSYTFRIRNHNNTVCYESYTAALNKTYTNGEATLTLDGCSTAEFDNGSVKRTGTFTYASSIIGEYIVTVTVGNSTYIYLTTANSTTGEYTFTEKNAGYAEYRFADTDGYVKTPYLTVNGDGTASLYEKNSGVFEVISTGTLTANNGFYDYVVTGEVADWATTKAVKMTMVIDTTSTSYNIFYLISSEDKEGTVTSYADVYTAADGSTFIKTAYFAIYKDANGNVLATGLYTDKTDYISLASTYFFVLSETDKTFTMLASEPLVLYLRTSSGINKNVTITITGNVVEDNYEAIYAETVDDVTTTYTGYYSYNLVSAMGSSAYIYKFVSNDKTFKFRVTGSSSTYYFYQYDIDTAIVLTTITKTEDDATYNADVTLQVTDTGVVYKTADSEVVGTVTSTTHTVFTEYEITVYTFTSNDNATTFSFTLLSSGSYFRMSGEDATYRAEDGSRIELDGATNIAKYTDAYSNQYVNYLWSATNTLDETKKAFMLYANSTSNYFDLVSDDMFELRGTEAASYLYIKNNMPDGSTLTFDGHGNVTLTKGEETTKGTYTISGDSCVLTFANDLTRLGSLGTYTYNSTTYRAFHEEITGFNGAYLDESDLTVLVLDSFGNVTKYSSYGVASTGTYVILDDGLFYYQNAAGTDAGLYSFNNGKLVKANYSATYYASDLSSVIFYQYGIVLFDNGSAAYYTYNEETNQIHTYKYGIEDANKYGYVVKEFVVEQGKLTYESKTYTLFDDEEITLTDAAGNTLAFTPDGTSSFTVEAVYTEKATGIQTSYYVVVSYDDDNVMTMYLANYDSIHMNGSANTYNVLYNYDLTVNLDDGSFVFDSSNYICGITAYDYLYIAYVSSYGSSYAQYFTSYYGYLQLLGSNTENGLQFQVSGSLNYLTDDDGKAVTFSKAELSQSGYYHSSYGSMFTCEFVGSDSKTYHLTFFLTTYSGYYTYIVYALTRVTNTVDLGNNSKVYEEELVYSLFNFTKTTDEEGNATYYAVGDAFYPTLRYKGELICTYDWELKTETQWVFATEVVKSSSLAYNYYYLNFLTADDGKIESGEVKKYEVASYSNDGYTVYALVDADDGSIFEIVSIQVGANTSAVSVTKCEKNENGSFTITTENGKYTISFTTEAGDDGEQVTKVHVEKLADEAVTSESNN